MNSSSNIPQLASQIIERCKYINENRLEALENLLYTMQYKSMNGQDGSERQDRDDLRRVGDSRLREQQAEEERRDPALLDHLDDYLEELYDDESAVKVRATARILELARNPDNLDYLVRHETLLGTISRVLREDARKSSDLALNIIYIYWTLSNFTQFHPVLATQQAGLNCLKVIEYEIKRAEVMTQETQRGGEQALMMKLRRQDRVLYVCFHVLLNLAQDLNVERKMLKKGLIGPLVLMLHRDNEELAILVLTFLKKLSLFRENLPALLETDAVALAAAKHATDNEVLLSVLLGFLLNISFDPRFRAKMVDAGLIPKLVDLLPHKEAHRVGILRVLYHLSMEEAANSVFCYTDAIPLVMQLLLDFSDRPGSQEVHALAINLALNSRNAELMCAGDGLVALVERAVTSQSPLVLKIIRNITLHDGPLRVLFAPYVVGFVKLAKLTKNPDVLVETLGCLGNFVIPGFDYSKLISDFGLVDFLHRYLTPGSAEDDLVLEAVIFTGTLLSDEDVPEVLVGTPLIRDLFRVLQEKQEDSEILLQLLFVFLKLLAADETRDAVISQTQTVFYLIDLLFHERPDISRLADQCLDIVAEVDPDWAAKIRVKKFQLHNSAWVEVVEEEGDDFDEGDSGLHQWDAHRAGAGFQAFALDEFEDNQWD